MAGRRSWCWAKKILISVCDGRSGWTEIVHRIGSLGWANRCCPPHPMILPRTSSGWEGDLLSVARISLRRCAPSSFFVGWLLPACGCECGPLEIQSDGNSWLTTKQINSRSLEITWITFTDVYLSTTGWNNQKLQVVPERGCETSRIWPRGTFDPAVWRRTTGL